VSVPDPERPPATTPAHDASYNGTHGGPSARQAGPFTLLDFEALRALPDASWLIDGMVPTDGLGFIYGASQAGKSFLALDWALSVAAGIPWFGHDVTGGHVVYIAGEGRSGMKQRTLAWWKEHGRPDLSRMHWLLDSVNLLNPGDIERALASRGTLPERPALWVGDTLARLMPGGDENASRDTGIVVAAMDQLRDGAAALIVHHTRRDGDGERGSGALRGGADVMVKLKRDGYSPRITLTCDKAKDAAEFDPVPLSLDPSEKSCVLSIRVDSPADRDELRKNVLALIDERGPISKNELNEAITGRRRELFRIVDEFVEEGVVHRPTRDGFEVVPETLGTTGNHLGGAHAAGVVPSGGERDVVPPRREPPRGAWSGSGSAGPGTGPEPFSDEDRAEELLERHEDIAGGEA
jgi:hypothetical protein